MALVRAWRVLPAGVAMGLLLAVGVQLTSTPWAVGILMLLGFLGGVLVVPLNALLQYRGHRLLQPGQSIAIQGFNENAGVLLSTALLAAALRADVPLVPLLTSLGLMLSASMAALWLVTRQWRADRPTKPTSE